MISMLTIRFLDISISLLGLLLMSPVLLIILIIGYFDTGSPLFRQDRVGKNRSSFVLIKFRTMNVGTANTATHLASASSITRFGRFLRASKLDELPQLYNVFLGEMSLVGPRPNLFNQKELIIEREKQGVYSVKPGITGLAQINGVDMSNPKVLAAEDRKMIEDFNILTYLKLLLMTLLGKGLGDRVRS